MGTVETLNYVSYDDHTSRRLLARRDYLLYSGGFRRFLSRGQRASSALVQGQLAVAWARLLGRVVSVSTHGQECTLCGGAGKRMVRKAPYRNVTDLEEAVCCDCHGTGHRERDPRRNVNAEELRQLVKSLRRDYDFDHHRPVVTVSLGDYEQLLKLTERCMRLEDMVVRLGSRGLVPCEHNLTIWQCPDDGRWGAAIQTPYAQYNAGVYGDTPRAALEELMRATNQGADLAQPEVTAVDVTGRTEIESRSDPRDSRFRE
jgi:hypothetical protein